MLVYINSNLSKNRLCKILNVKNGYMMEKLYAKKDVIMFFALLYSKVLISYFNWTF